MFSLEFTCTQLSARPAASVRNLFSDSLVPGPSPGLGQERPEELGREFLS